MTQSQYEDALGRRDRAWENNYYSLGGYEDDEEEEMLYFKSVHTGMVDTEENWRADADAEEWDFDAEVSSGQLVEVAWHPRKKEWVESW